MCIRDRYKHLGAPSNHDWHHPKDEDCFSARAFESVWRQSVGPSAKKLDCRLQTFLDDIKSGTRRDVNAEPHMYKAWHDEAAKLPESEARDWAMKRLEKLAKDCLLYTSPGPVLPGLGRLKVKQGSETER